MTPSPSIVTPRTRGRELLLPLAILVLGIVIGACGTVVFGRGFLLQRFLGPADAIPGDVIQRIGDELRLAPPERAKLQSIFEEHMRKVEAIRAEGRASVAKELDSLRDEVADALGDPRAQQWRARFEEARRAGARPMPPPRWGPEGPQPGPADGWGPAGPPNGADRGPVAPGLGPLDGGPGPGAAGPAPGPQRDPGRRRPDGPGDRRLGGQGPR